MLEQFDAKKVTPICTTCVKGYLRGSREAATSELSRVAASM